MDIEISEPGFDAPVISVVNNSFQLNTQYGKGVFACYQGKGFSFWNNNYHFSTETVLQARADLPVLELHITRSGSWAGQWEGVDEMLLQPGQFNLTYTPHVKTFAYFKQAVAYRSCDIHFEKSYLDQLAADFPQLDIFLTAVTYHKATSLAPRNHFCTKEMMTAVDAILDNPFGPRTQPYILEIKVKEILLCALEKVAGAVNDFTLSGNQQDALLFARQQIEGTADTPLSLTELAKQSGLNEFTLKKGFRHLFGISPYQYYVELKMKRAQQLLLDSSISVSSIAYHLGYVDPSNFTKEFKKATGLLPLTFRKIGGRN